jgi:hypothetical protein
MTTLTMRVVKGDFIRHRAGHRAHEVQEPPGGARLVQDPPSRLADHGGWPPRQASGTKETGALTRPADEPAQRFSASWSIRQGQATLKQQPPDSGLASNRQQKGQGPPPFQAGSRTGDARAGRRSARPRRSGGRERRRWTGPTFSQKSISKSVRSRNASPANTK